MHIHGSVYMLTTSVALHKSTPFTYNFWLKAVRWAFSRGFLPGAARYPEQAPYRHRILRLSRWSFAAVSRWSFAAVSGELFTHFFAPFFGGSFLEVFVNNIVIGLILFWLETLLPSRRTRRSIFLLTLGLPRIPGRIPCRGL